MNNNKAQIIAGLAAGLFLFVTIGLIGFYNQPSPIKANKPSPNQVVLSEAKYADERLDLFFFMPANDCKSCDEFKAIIISTLKKHFAKPLAQGKITLKALRLNDDEAKPLARHYGVLFQNLVISAKNKENELFYRKLDEVWQYMNDSDVVEGFLVIKIQKSLNSLNEKTQELKAK